MVWFAGTVRSVFVSQSLPTPKTSEPSRVAIRLAVGAPDGALTLFALPIAPEPFTPEESVPVKVTTVIEAATLCDRVARTVTFARAEGAKARHISAVPSCRFALRTRAHVRLAPLTPVTVIPDELESVEMKASKSSLPAEVENAGEVMLVLALERSVDLT